jgi:hypothetical protein
LRLAVESRGFATTDIPGRIEGAYVSVPSVNRETPLCHNPAVLVIRRKTEEATIS